MIIASRYLTRNRLRGSKRILSAALSQAGQYLFRLLMDIPIRDVSHGFRLFRRSMYDEVKNFITASGNTFMVDLTVQAYRKGFSIIEIPYSYGKRLHGKDKMQLRRESIRFMKYLYGKWGKG